MPLASRRRVPLSGLVVLAVLHLAVVVASPLFHHDAVCHLKTPWHCDACRACPAAAGEEGGPADSTVRLLAAGRVEAAVPDLEPAPPAPPSPGRSPPA